MQLSKKDLNQIYLRQIAKDTKDYLFSLSIDGNFSNDLFEIGANIGDNAEIFAQEFPFLRINSIELWTDSSEVIFDEKTKFYNNIRKMRGHIHDFGTEISSPVMVFIDQCFDPVCMEKNLSFWLNYLKSGSILSGNGFIDGISVQGMDKGLKKFLRSFIGNPNQVYGNYWVYIIP